MPWLAVMAGNTGNRALDLKNSIIYRERMALSENIKAGMTHRRCFSG